MMYVKYPLSLRQIEDLLFERGIDISHETFRFWWNRFGPMFAAEIRKKRVHRRSHSLWCWHVDEVFVRINGVQHYLWRAVDHEGEVIEVFASKRRNRKAALKFLRRAMKRYGSPKVIVTDRLASYGAALRTLGSKQRQRCGRWLNNRAGNSHHSFRIWEGAMARFRDIKTLQKLASSHAAGHNHFNHERHLLAAISTNKTAPLPWLSGGYWLLERLRGCVDQRPFVIGLTAPLGGLLALLAFEC